MDIRTRKEIVSIGMPVYNGARFLRRALDSLLAQEYQNFELLISDNASTDETSRLCKAYASKDKRIQYFRNERNVGALENFNRVFKLSSGEYFMWAAANDAWDTVYITRCKEILESDPEIVLCYTRTVLIDEGGNALRVTPDRFDTTTITDPVVRFSQTMWKVGWANILHGLIRSEAMRHTRLLIPTISASDYIFLAELSIQGTFAQIPVPLFYRYEDSPTERRLKKRLINMSTNKEIFMPHWRLMFHSWMVVKNAPFSPMEKAGEMADITYCVIKRFGFIEDFLRLVHLLAFARRIKKMGNSLRKKISR